MYDHLHVVSYNFGSLAIGAGGATLGIAIPRGARLGRVLDIHVYATVIFTQVTTPAYIRVGVSGTLAKFAELNMGAAAANAAYNGGDSNVFRALWRKDVDNVTDLIVTTVAPTGGAPTGTGIVTVVVGWDHIQSQYP